MSEIEIIEEEDGENLEAMIASVLVNSPTVAVKEFGCNSYDADAKIAKVDIDEVKRTIRFWDNGHSMNEKGLLNFKRRGDSEKIAHPISPGGRRRIGRFGIAATLLRYLGSGYDIELFCNGEHIVGSESFEEETGLEYDISKCDKEMHETAITVKGCRFIGTRFLSTRALRKALTWEIPNREDLKREGRFPEDDFTVFLNEEEMVRQNSAPERSYRFKGKLKHAGDVEMTVDYFLSIPRMSSILLYINDRSVEIPISLKRIKYLGNRLFVRVDANGLQKHISFNRGFIQEDNPAYHEVKSWIMGRLEEVEEAIIPTLGIKRKRPGPIRQRLHDAIEEAAEVEEKIEKAGMKSKAPADSGKPAKLFESLGFSKINVVNLGATSPPTTYNLKTEELTINEGHPWYTCETDERGVLTASILLGIGFAKAEASYLHSNLAASETIGKFHGLCAKLLAAHSTEAARAKPTGMFTDARAYTRSEICEHMSLACLNELLECGLLTEEDERVMGKILNDYFEKAKGKTPALEIVRRVAGEMVSERTGEEVSRERIRQRYANISGQLIKFEGKVAFAHNIGTNERPFYLIEDCSIPRFVELYSSGFFDGKAFAETALEKHRTAYQKALKSPTGFIGLEEMCQMTGAAPHEVFAIVSYAQLRGMNLETREKDGALTFSSEDFLNAKEEYTLGVKRGL